MADELSQDGANETETEVEGTGTDQAKTAKTFTQEEVNKYLAKEKASWKKSTDKDKQLWEAAETSLRSDVEFYETKFKDILSAQTKDFDQITLELFNALPVREQMEKLSNPDFLSKVKKKAVIPETPTEQKSNNNGQSIFKRKTTI